MGSMRILVCAKKTKIEGVLESIHWTQTAYAILCQQHHACVVNEYTNKQEKYIYVLVLGNNYHG